MAETGSDLLKRKDDVLWEGRVGLLCNQTAFSEETGEYLFQALAKRGCLKRVFVPEHGLFAELQDQVPLEQGSIYASLAPGVDFVSLYGSTEATLVPDMSLFDDVEALIIDIQDVGSRYYTFATTAAYLLQALHQHNRSICVYVVDRPNPAGRQVEGTMLPVEYQSFVGMPGIVHRHGLTIGELLSYVHKSGSMRYALIIQTFADEPRAWSGGTANYPQAPRSAWTIAPSPNMPSPVTPLVYSGQCLLEGTNMSEGRGTTRPFEIFGAPYLDWTNVPRQDGALLRPTRFIPTFHKHASQVCAGFQIHVVGTYPSLIHSLKILRWARERFREFAWREGAYEFRSDKPAIELLCGDRTLVDFLNGKATLETLQSRLRDGEEEWVRQMKPHLLYKQPLTRVG